MKQYELKVKGKHQMSDDQLNRFNLDNIFDVITVVRNKSGESIILKNTNNFDICFIKTNEKNKLNR